jgi:hypothetical protein
MRKAGAAQPSPVTWPGTSVCAPRGSRASPQEVTTQPCARRGADTSALARSVRKKRASAVCICTATCWGRVGPPKRRKRAKSAVTVHPLGLPRAHAPCWSACAAPRTSPATHQGHAGHDTRIERESAPLQPLQPWAFLRSASLSHIRRPASCPSRATRSSDCARQTPLPGAGAVTRRSACSARRGHVLRPRARQSRPRGRSFRARAGRHSGRAGGWRAARDERGAKRWGARKKLAGALEKLAGGSGKARGSARFSDPKTALSA